MSAPAESFTIPKSLVRQVGVVLGTLAALAILAALIYALVQQFSGPRDPLASAINSREYQAVFLTNSQVYFGKLTAPGGDYYYLRDIYYLSQQASPQSGKAPRQTLVKLGNEIHGPEDLMVVNRSQILFVENLKPNGKVSQAITSAQSGH